LAAAEGDAEAEEVWGRSLRILACALASLVNILDPEVVVLGGGIAEAGARLFEPLARELERVEWRPYGDGVAVLPAALGSHAGAIGAARFAMLDGRA
jgi:glucokinase